MFESSGNKRGTAACQNNLGAVAMSSGRFLEAEQLYQQAISNGERLVTELADPFSVARMNCTISDRRGNLALLRIQEQKYPEAFALLEKSMEADKASGYIKGCVVKQGTLGQLYLAQVRITVMHIILFIF